MSRKGRLGTIWKSKSGSASHETFTTWTVWHTFFSVRDVFMWCSSPPSVKRCSNFNAWKFVFGKKIIEMYSLLFHTFLRAKKKLPPMDLSFTCFHLQSTTSNTSCWGMPLVRWSSGTQDAYVEFFFGWACLETTMKPASSWPWIWSLGRVFFSSKSPLGLIVFQIITLYVQISNLKNCKLRRVWICLWTFLGNLWKGHQNKVYVIPKWPG